MKCCFVSQVRVIYSNSNIWANLQVSTQPWTICWDLQNKNNWLAFFNSSFPHCELATVQTDVHYTELDDRVYEELEVQVEEIVRQSIYGGWDSPVC